MPSALTDVLAASGGTLGAYRGADTAARFSDLRSEYEAFRSGCAVYDLGWRSKILVSGPDRVRWLNGMVTNNIRDLTVNRGVYCFLLNAQGRIQADMYAYNRGEYLLIDTDQSQRGRLLDTFEKFIIMDDVEAMPADDKLTAIGLRGPKASEVLSKAGLSGKAGLSANDVAPLEVCDTTLNEISLSLVCTDREHSFELWMSPQNAATAWNAMVAARATPVGFEALELARVAAGVPLYGQDIRERDLPQETGQQRALHFQKGCYVGQEIVERIHSRGNVHREFVGFCFDGAAPASGSKILAAGKEVGEITSTAALPNGKGDRAVALGYIRREAAVSNAELDVGGTRAHIAALPFEKV